MNHRIVTVQFSRAGDRDNFELDPDSAYRVRIDGEPPEEFRPPWAQGQLDDNIEVLRNKSDDRPTTELIKDLGKEIGNAMHAVNGMEAKLTPRDEAVTLILQLDYPELARIPWEIATINRQPYHHLLDRDISIVRKVPAVIQDAQPLWPTGRNESLRLLFVWGETKPDDVPHKEHLPLLQQVCDEYGVELVHQEITDIASLTNLCKDTKKPFHFVHILAHGARAQNREWGLRLKDEVVKGEQLARALQAGGTIPALATVSACDSANEKDNSFGSVAYELHVYGVPLVVASQFRLRKSASVVSAAEVYKQLLGGGDLREMLKGIRRQLAPADNEAWANEVVYSSYRYESMEDLVAVARQQGALRRANAIERKARDAAREDRQAFIEALDEETEKLRILVERQKFTKVSPEALAETYGLLGSMQRRKARLRSDPPHEDEEDLRDARSYYEDGMRADANSHYCGINVVHISLRLGDHDKAEEFIPLVRFAAESQIERDFWALATAGELEVYAGDADKAADHYRAFVRNVEAKVDGKRAIIGTLNSSRRQLNEVSQVFEGEESIRKAAEASLKVLDSAINRNA
jgi:hypothetical protein